VLGATDVGSADHADPAVAPGLLADPGGAVDTVGAIVAHPVPHALAFVAAAAVLGDEGVAVFGEVLAEALGTVLVVGQAGEDDGMATGQDLAVLGGQVDVGGQMHAVAHGHPQVFFDHDVLGAGGGEPEQGGDLEEAGG
jgi:hypothetical protein